MPQNPAEAPMAPPEAPMGAPEAPMGAEAPTEGAPAGGNPVADALRTIATFVTAQRDKGNPRSAEMLSALQKLLQTITGGAEAPAAAAPPMEAPPAPAAAPAPKPSESSRPIPMNAKEGAVPVL